MTVYLQTYDIPISLCYALCLVFDFVINFPHMFGVQICNT